MGGSFSEIGGHNPLEPALFNKPIIVGHNMSNFNEIMQKLRQEKAIVELSSNKPSTQLFNEVNTLLQQPNQQKILGENAFNVVLANQGASDISLLEVQRLLATIDTGTKPLGDNS